MKEEQDSKSVIGPVLFLRLLILFIAFVGVIVIPHSIDVQKVSFETSIPVLERFASWDTVYYFDIAAKGTAGYVWAFRPLYPAILGVLRLPFTGLGANSASLVAGVIWNTFALVLAAIYLYKLTELLYDKKSAHFTVLLLSISPAAVFFTAPYPEATYLLLFIASFYYLEKKQFLVATILGFLAALTRPEAFLICILFLLKALFSRGRERLQTFLGAVAVSLSLPFFMLFSYLVTGDAFISFSQEVVWSKTTLMDVLVKFYHNEFIYGWEVCIMSTAVLAFVVWAMVTHFFSIQVKAKRLAVHLKQSFKDRQTPYFLYAIFLLVFFVVYGEFKSFPRYTLTLFPILWANSLWANGNLTRTYLLFSFFASLMALGTLLFTNWYPFI